MLYSWKGTAPALAGEGHFIAPNATVIGNVRLGPKTSVWYGVVMRGDHTVPMEIGEGSNIQDNSVCHTDEGVPFRIGRYNTVGHKVIMHGCVTGDNVLIGMGSTLMNRVTIGDNVIIGANSLIPEGKEIPSGVLVLGAPAKVIRPLTETEIQMIRLSAEHYIQNAASFAGGDVVPVSGD